VKFLVACHIVLAMKNVKTNSHISPSIWLIYDYSNIYKFFYKKIHIHGGMTMDVGSTNFTIKWIIKLLFRTL
jgi:hypothetical protein